VRRLVRARRPVHPAAHATLQEAVLAALAEAVPV
jgi:hypothetical protein